MEVLPSTLKALEEVLVTWSRLQSAVCELREDLEPSNAPHLIFRGTGHARDLTSPISLWPLSPAQQPHLEGIPGFFCGVQNWHCEGLLDKCLHRMQKVGGHSCLCDLTVSGGESTWSKGSFSRRRKSNSDLVAARHRPSQVKHLSVQSTMHRRFSQPQEQVLVSRQDIINKKDAWEKQEFIRMSIQYMLQHPAFQLLLALLLVTNAITIALRTNSFFDQKHFELFSVIDDIVLTTLICEVLLRWLSGFWIFWQDGWNVLNFFIVCMLVLGVLNMVNVSITYCLRVLRLVHVCMAVEPLARIIRVILQAGPGMAQIGVLILFVMLVFALLGVTLFGEFVPTHFGNLGVALYTLFVCLTQDGWVDIYDDFRNIMLSKCHLTLFMKTCPVMLSSWEAKPLLRSRMKERDYALETGGAIYFAIFIIIGGIIGMNLLVTVVIRNLEQIMKTEEQEQQHQKNFSETGAEKEDWSHELPLLHCAVARMEKSGLHQEPLVGSPMSNLSENMLDNFCLVLEAIEENVTQYKKIREELDNIVQKVRSIPFNQEQMEELLRRLMSMSLMDSGSSMDLHNIAKQQDLFTALVSRAKVYESLTNMALSKQKFSS